MRWLLVSAALLAFLASVRSGEYCDDFEDGDLGPFWNTSDLDSRGHWKASSYQELKRSIPDFPAPTGGDTLVYLTADSGQIYVSARLQMSDEYVFPAGSSISFRYWLRTDYSGSGTLEVRHQIGAVEEKEPIISLTEASGPNNTEWMEISSPIPDSTKRQKIIIFGSCANHDQDNIAVDDIKICGPQGLDQQCYPVTTTTETPSTTEEPTTTEEPATTEEPTTTEDPTTAEPSPTSWPSTSPAPPPSPGEYCDDFESDDFGLFWHQSRRDVGGRWEPASYSSLQQTVPNFPPPPAGDTLVYLTLSENSSFAAGRLEMVTEMVFPEGSSFSFRYWLRSQWPTSAALYVKREVGQREDLDPLLDLTDTADPENDQWMEATVAIPADSQPAKIIIFGSCGTQPLDNIAIDDLRICGPQGLDHQCVSMAASWH